MFKDWKDYLVGFIWLGVLVVFFVLLPYGIWKQQSTSIVTDGIVLSKGYSAAIVTYQNHYYPERHYVCVRGYDKNGNVQQRVGIVDYNEWLNLKVNDTIQRQMWYDIKDIL